MSIISQPLPIIIVLFPIVNIVIGKTRDLLLIETLIYTLLRREQETHPKINADRVSSFTPCGRSFSLEQVTELRFPTPEYPSCLEAEAERRMVVSKIVSI
jgi:hypothetical protein